MLYIYGSLLPVRILEETVFWKAQEKEHTEVIKGIVPELEEPYVNLLDQWAIVFAATGQAARNLLEAALAPSTAGYESLEAETERLVHTACGQSREFIHQLHSLREASPAVGVQPLAGIVILHIIRESEYFLTVLGGFSAPGQVAGLMRNAAFERNSATELEQPEDNELYASEDHADSTVSADYKDLPHGTREPGVVPVGGHTLPPLPYAYNALEPYIDEQTMVIHHDKHHKSYVDGLNKAETKLADARKSGDFDLVKHWERELAFNGAGHYLHTLLWNIMSPQGGGRPTGALLDAIERSFGSYDAFKAQFSEAANKVEGGGWAILVWSPRSRRLEILTAEKHQNLSQWDVVPLLALDVWEHAYYLKHQNDRAGYINDWWKVVNWPYVSERYAAARKLIWQPY